MAFPTIISTQTSQQTGATTTSNVTLPASVAAGDLIIAFVGSDSGAGAHTWPSPWVPLKDDAGTGFRVAIAYLIASGGETTVAVTHTSERSNHIAVRIADANWQGTTPPEITAAATGSSNAPNPGALSPTWGSADTLWISAIVCDDSVGGGVFPVTAWPEADNRVSNATASSAAAIAICSGGATGASRNPGTFTLTNSETWSAYTIAVRPAQVLSVTLGQPSDTESPFAVAHLKTRTAALATQIAATALAVTRRKTRAVAQAADTCSAQPVAVIQKPDPYRRREPFGAVAGPISSYGLDYYRRGRPFGFLTIGTAVAQFVDVLQAAEADAATATAKAKVKAVGQAAETTTAQPVARIKRKAVGQTASADTALTLVTAVVYTKWDLFRDLCDTTANFETAAFAGGTTEATGGLFRIDDPSPTDGYGLFQSTAAHDLTSSHVTVQIITAPTQTDSRAYFALIDSTAAASTGTDITERTGGKYAMIEIPGTSLGTDYRAVSGEVGAGEDYDETVTTSGELWLKISEDSGTVHFWYSGDQDTWTEIGTGVLTPAWISQSYLELGLYTNTAVIDLVEFDNINGGLGVAHETDSSEALTALKTVAVGQVTSTQTAGATIFGKTASVVDTFQAASLSLIWTTLLDSGVTTRLNEVDPGEQVAEILTDGSKDTAYGSFITRGRYDLTDSEITVFVDEPDDLAAATTFLIFGSGETQPTDYESNGLTGSYGLYVSWEGFGAVDAGDLVLGSQGSTDGGTHGGWVKVSESGGTISFYISPGRGPVTWTEIGAGYPTPVWASAAYIELGFASSNSSVNAQRFDDVNIPAHVVVLGQASDRGFSLPCLNLSVESFDFWRRQEAYGQSGWPDGYSLKFWRAGEPLQFLGPALSTVIVADVLQAVETDTATVTPSRSTIYVDVAQASSTDAAGAVTTAKAKATGQASDWHITTRGWGFEWGTGWGGIHDPVTARKTKTLEQATATETSQALVHVGGYVVALNTETDTAQAATSRKTKTLGQAADTSVAEPFTVEHEGVTGQTTETDTAQPATTQKLKAFGQATTLSAALPAVVLKTQQVGQAVETDTAQAATTEREGVLGQPASTDTATVAQPLKTAHLAVTADTEAALAATSIHTQAVGQAEDTETATGLGVEQPTEVDVAQAAETDTADTTAVIKSVTLGLPAETDTAAGLASSKVITVGQASDTESAPAAVPLRMIPVGAVTELDVTAGVLLVLKTLRVGASVETDRSLRLHVQGAPPPRATRTHAPGRTHERHATVLSGRHRTRRARTGETHA